MRGHDAGSGFAMVTVRKKFALSGFVYFCVMLGISSALEGNGQAPTFSAAVSHYPFIESENVYLSMLAGKPCQYLFDMEEGCEISRRFKLKSFLFNYIIGNYISIPNVSFNFFRISFLCCTVICMDTALVIYRRTHYPVLS